MGIFDFLRRRKQQPVVAPPAVQPAKNVREVPAKVNAPGVWSKPKNVSKTPPEFARGDAYLSGGRLFPTKWYYRFFRSKEDPRNAPNKAYNRLNLASKEARRREMQKRRASLQYRPTAPFGRR